MHFCRTNTNTVAIESPALCPTAMTVSDCNYFFIMKKNYTDHKMKYAICLFCPTNGPKFKTIKIKQYELLNNFKVKVTNFHICKAGIIKCFCQRVKRPIIP